MDGLINWGVSIKWTSNNKKKWTIKNCEGSEI